MNLAWKKLAGVLVMSLVMSVAAGAAGEKEKESKGTKISLEQALKKVFPELTNHPEAEAIYVDDKSLASKCDYEKDKGCKVYPVKKKDLLLGYAIAWTSEDGFKDLIKVLVGITCGGEIVGLEILEQNETPNRGSKITEAEFLNQFVKRNLQNTSFKIEKDGGDIKAVSGASFSSKAVVSAVKEALEFYGRNKDSLAKKPR